VGLRYTQETHNESDGSKTVAAYPSGETIVAIPTGPQSVSASDPTYRLSLDHRFTPDVLAYLSFNTGFKSGGFNAGPVGSPPYSPEKVKTYELGVKSDLFDRVRLNVAAFYNDYTEIQIQELLGGSIGVVNGPSAKIYGGEADVSARISEGLTLTSAVTALSPTFGTFLGCHITPAGGGIPAILNGDCSHNQVPLAARASANAGLDYTVRNVLGGDVTLNGHAYYTSKFYWDVGNNYFQGGYTTFGASAFWTDPGSHWTVRLYGSNLGNKLVATWVGINETAGNINEQYLDPRLFGVTFGYKF
jgi:iron complex outermembrane recepter protein